MGQSLLQNGLFQRGKVTKKELEIPDTHGADIVSVAGECDIYELGSGSGKKTASLLATAAKTFSPVQYFPIDINERIMVEGAQKIIDLVPEVHINCLAGPYERVLQARFDGIRRKLVLFMGSSISQEKNDDLLVMVRSNLKPNDLLLVGFDLQKNTTILRIAYQNDAAEKLSRNVLHNLNRTFRGDFDQSNFSFTVRYNDAEGGTETGQTSMLNQIVWLKGLGLRLQFKEGEFLRTAAQRKFRSEDIQKRFEARGFELVTSFFDKQKWCSMMLFKAR